MISFPNNKFELLEPLSDFPEVEPFMGRIISVWVKEGTWPFWDAPTLKYFLKWLSAFKPRRRLPVSGSISGLATSQSHHGANLNMLYLFQRSGAHGSRRKEKNTTALRIGVWNPQTLPRHSPCTRDQELNIYKSPWGIQCINEWGKETSYISHSETSSQNIIIFIRPKPSMGSQSLV